MAKKTSEEIREDVKKATDAIAEAASNAVDAAKPVVAKARKAAKPAMKKAAAAGKTVKETAKKVAPQKPEYYVQFAGQEIDMDDLAARAKAAFKAENKRSAVLSCRIYLKPEDSAAYYVINDTFFGKLSL